MLIQRTLRQLFFSVHLPEVAQVPQKESGDGNDDITSSSTQVSSFKDYDGTYTATSTLLYKINKIYNQQSIAC